MSCSLFSLSALKHGRPSSFSLCASQGHERERNHYDFDDSLLQPSILRALTLTDTLKLWNSFAAAETPKTPELPPETPQPPPPWLCESGCPLGEILWYLLRGIPTLAPVDRAFDSLSAGLPRITYQWRQAEKRSTVWMPTLKLWGASTRLERGESAKKNLAGLFCELPRGQKKTVSFAILCGVLCNSSHFYNEGEKGGRVLSGQYLCQQACAQLGLLVWDFSSSTQSLMSLPLHSCSLSLPHISSICPRDPKFNYCQVAVGGSCAGTAERNSDTQHVQRLTSSRHWQNNRGVEKAAISAFNYLWSMEGNNMRKRRAAYVVQQQQQQQQQHAFLTDKRAAREMERWSWSTPR